MMKHRLWLALIILALITPLGNLFRSTAWGEWSSAEMESMLGFAPSGIQAAETWYRGVFPDYSITASTGLAAHVGYALSAIIGSLLIIAISFLWVKIAGKTRGH